MLTCADVSFRSGQAGYTTPAIDALAHSGIILDNYYVQVPSWLLAHINNNEPQPFCSPTRSALLSSRCVTMSMFNPRNCEPTDHECIFSSHRWCSYPYTTGLAHTVIDGGQAFNLALNLTLLPQVLKQASYATHAVGKWHVRLSRACRHHMTVNGSSGTRRGR